MELNWMNRSELAAEKRRSWIWNDRKIRDSKRVHNRIYTHSNDVLEVFAIFSHEIYHVPPILQSDNLKFISLVWLLFDLFGLHCCSYTSFFRSQPESYCDPIDWHRQFWIWLMVMCSLAHYILLLSNAKIITMAVLTHDFAYETISHTNTHARTHA